MVRFVGATVGALLLASLIGLSGGGSAAAAEKSIWGPLTLPDGSDAFPLYRRLGVDNFQIQLDWPRTAPARPADPSNHADPAYRWPPALDQAIARARRQRISIAVLVTRSPRWANGNRPANWTPDPAEYANFVSAASRRYPTVRRWMIWGEPNLADRYMPNEEGKPTSARNYARLLDAAYAALKRVTRRNVVVGGMTWTGGTVKPARFLRAMRLPNGRPPRLDWFGHNAFPFRYPSMRERPLPGGWRDMSDLDTFSREVHRTYTRPCGRRRARRCGKRPKLWLSEFTVQTDRASDAFKDFVSPRQQARWLSAGYEIGDRLSSVAGVGWFQLLDPPSSETGAANLGLMRADGRRKPSFGAYLRAPSRRFRPRVSVGKRRTTGVRVRIRPRASGRLVVELHSRGGRIVREKARVRANRTKVVRLRSKRLRRGIHSLVVEAPRGERVRREVRVR